MVPETAGFSDRERLIRVEAMLESLQKLIDERSQADRTMYNEKLTNLGAQMITLASAHDRLAAQTQVDKMEVRLEAAEKLIADMNSKVAMREAVDARFDQVGTRMESMSGGIQRLDSNLLKLTTVLQEDDTQSKIASERMNTRRSQIFGGIAALAAVAGIVVSLLLGFHDSNNHPTIVIEPPTTTTTTLVGRGP